jgi:NAD(P)-dependent dehydrogenase (short-subunit alcohol dehydrogenase family)
MAPAPFPNEKRTARVAFVTGASRGIGKASALALAREGFDVAITARTLREGEQREHSATIRASDTRPLPGSLETTAALIASAGREALVLPADLLDRSSLEAAAHAVLDHWGHVDVIVHNARYIGPGHMDRFLETPIELLALQLEANVIAPLVLNRILLAAMVSRGRGMIVNITSASGYADPLLPAGAGGWGMGYGMSKAAFHRIAGFVAVEHAGDGILCFNVQPGVIATERGAIDAVEFGFGDWGAPPSVVGAVVAWLATSPDASSLNGTTIEAQFLCASLGLVPGWAGPEPNRAAIRYDAAPEALRLLEERLAAQGSSVDGGSGPSGG